MMLIHLFPVFSVLLLSTGVSAQFFSLGCSVTKWSPWHWTELGVKCQRTRKITDPRKVCVKPSLKETREGKTCASLVAGNLAQKLFCTNQKADFMLAIDGSGSIPKKDFEFAKSVAKAFAQNIDDTLGLGDDKSRIALIVFSNENAIKVHLDFTKHDLNEINEVIDNAARPGKTTFTGEALEKAQEVWLDKAREGTIRQMLVFSDGKSNGKIDPCKPAEEIRIALDVEIFGWALGKVTPASQKELECIVSEPPEDHINFSKNFKDANKAVQTVLKNIKTLCK